MEKKIFIINCKNKCCSLYFSEYKGGEWLSDEEWYKTHKYDTNNKKIKKAGTFILDSKNNKILIVQARGRYWGSPKGSIDNDETVKECAIRETMEETGIKIDESLLKSYTCIKGKCIYYDIELEEFTPYVQNSIKDNDANGIGWVKIDCLKEMIEDKKVVINQHLRLLIKKKFEIDLLYNKYNDSTLSTL